MGLEGIVVGPHDLSIGATIGGVAPGEFVAPSAGHIDEVEIHNRALSASEIQAIFNAGSAGKCKTLTVVIDIKPGSFPNSINLGSGGNVPVAICSTLDFDATTVDPLTVTLASAPAKLKGKGTQWRMCRISVGMDFWIWWSMLRLKLWSSARQMMSPPSRDPRSMEGSFRRLIPSELCRSISGN